MRRRIELLVLVAVLFVISAPLCGAEAILAADCPRDIQCPDVWDPVICDDGVVYSNSCYAYRACATGCVPYGGGPVQTTTEIAFIPIEPDCPPAPVGCEWQPGTLCRVLVCVD
jgi:hypothetical protein